MVGFKVFLFIVLVSSTRAQMEDEALDEEQMHPSFREESLWRVASRKPALLREGEDTHEFWLNMGKEFVKQQKQQKQNTNVAKNTILFLGDGMSLTTLVAARSYIGAEHTKLSFEEFPTVGLSKTYSVDKIVPDSATTATAYLCGVKANYGTIGVNAAVQRYDCEAMKNSSNHVSSLAKWALDAGKSAGLVTTARVTHASPAGVYAHTADRNWESNADIEEACGQKHGLDDIAQQLIHGEVGAQLKVIMGGGKNVFIDKSLHNQGWRTDGRNLIEEYKNHSTKNVFVETKEELNKLNFSQAERLLGLFNDDHIDYYLESLENKTNTQPTLEEMTKAAIEFLKQQGNENGYFLFVEGARIDMAHHDTKARLALEETKQFSQAIKTAREMTSTEDTLIVVTSDHSHTFSVAGYQARGSDIFTLVPEAADKKPYQPLSYANGRGYNKHYNARAGKRQNPQTVLTGAANDEFPATVPLQTETHGGEDVAVFASGPWAHLFSGVYEQNAIPHMMAYATCVGEGLKACDTQAQAGKMVESI